MRIFRRNIRSITGI